MSKRRLQRPADDVQDTFSDTRPSGRARRAKKSAMRFQPERVRAAEPFPPAIPKVAPAPEQESGHAVCMSLYERGGATRTQHTAFWRRDFAVWQQETPRLNPQRD